MIVYDDTEFRLSKLWFIDGLPRREKINRKEYDLRNRIWLSIPPARRFQEPGIIAKANPNFLQTL
jgi:hypothetical protein